jgi:geranylgeranyl pyrophosphate synthase/predicted secreted hydrolase
MQNDQSTARAHAPHPSQPPAPAEDEVAVPVSARNSGFFPARAGDWPPPGPIDLAVHDAPHRSSTTEWWYMNAHLTGQSGRRYGLFVAFFRQVRRFDPKTKQPIYMHSITWGLSDLDAQRYVAHSGLDRSSPEEGLRQIEHGMGSTDTRWNRAVTEVLRRGRIPRPDHLFNGGVFVSERTLHLDYAGDSLRKRDDGSYELQLFNQEKGAGCHLVFEPLKQAIRHGTDGVVPGADNERMFYYFIPRNRVTGSVVMDGRREEVAHGQGWYDHEFGMGEVYSADEADTAHLDGHSLLARRAQRRARKEQNAIGWDWLSVQLEDGSDLTVYSLVFLHGGQPAGSYAVLSDPNGNRTCYTKLSFEPTRHWQSTQTFITHPVAWRVRVPEAGIDVEVESEFEDQEFITLVTKLSFWEGHVKVRGTVRGRPSRGVGVVERSGFGAFESLDAFFDAVGHVVRKRVDAILPREPSPDAAKQLVASKERGHYVRDVDLAQLGRTLIHPIRDVVDRGGKGWRSYALIACCDLVGGDSRNFVDWIAFPELMHVGSLIIDDVQDESAWRRGGPSAHVMHGKAQAINAGTAAYFVCSARMLPESISNADRIRIYNYYFECLRAGHAGQAIDLDGFGDLLPDVVATGDAKELERRVRAVHRLKTAAPAGCLARIGAVLGGGTDAQIEAVGQYFEAVGLAFQAMDDVLNLRGFKKDLKTRAEDITHGKVTLPVAKALGKLNESGRRWLQCALEAHTTDLGLLEEAVDLLEECGAVQECVNEAHGYVEEAWRGLDPLVDDSLTKVMLRAFSWYLLERHY